jgi:hypothetical protein
MVVRWLVMGAWLLLVIGLGLAPVARTDAEETPGWEAIGPAEQSVSRLHTPTSGALLAEAKELLLRTDDGGATWRTIEWPAETSVVTVSPTNHDLLFAAGAGGVRRSDDGGATWTQVSDLADSWRAIEASPADPDLLYGVTSTSLKESYGRETITYAFRVSHDAGATWDVTRTYDERRVQGSYPCGYTYRRLVPAGVTPERVLTIEGCVVQADPRPSMSADEGRTSTLFPDLGYAEWGANAAVGGRGANPSRWYVSSFRSNVVYTRIRHSKLMRTDDDGASWAAVFDDDTGDPYKNPKPADFITRLAYDPGRPDNVFAVFEHYQPSSVPSKEPTAAGSAVRMSRDGGVTWTGLASEGLPSVNDLAVGVDGRYLFAATGKGVYRLTLAP